MKKVLLAITAIAISGILTSSIFAQNPPAKKETKKEVVSKDKKQTHTKAKKNLNTKTNQVKKKRA